MPQYCKPQFPPLYDACKHFLKFQQFLKVGHCFALIPLVPCNNVNPRQTWILDSTLESDSRNWIPDIPILNQVPNSLS